jgi:hypothetical protein
MRRSLEEQTFARFLRDHRRPGIATFQYGLWRFEYESAFRLRLIVARDAIVFEDWQNFPLKVHRPRVFDLGDRNGFGAGRVRPSSLRIKREEQAYEND